MVTSTGSPGDVLGARGSKTRVGFAPADTIGLARRVALGARVRMVFEDDSTLIVDIAWFRAPRATPRAIGIRTPPGRALLGATVGSRRSWMAGPRQRTAIVTGIWNSSQVSVDGDSRMGADSESSGADLAPASGT
jgi:hypothetical protein